MNKKSRALVAEIIERLRRCHEDLEGVKDDEQEKFDNMPEGLQESERGQAIQNVADSLEEICEDLGGVISDLEELEN